MSTKIASLLELRPGSYFYDSVNPIETDALISALSGADSFGLGPMHSVEPQVDVFLWGAEAASYFFLDNIFDELAIGIRLEAESEESVTQSVELLLKSVGLDEFCQVSRIISPWQLSGGQQQRLLLALLISRKYQFVIAFNPLIYVDYRSRYELYRLAIDYTRRIGGVFIITSHESRVPVSLIDRTIRPHKTMFEVTNRTVDHQSRQFALEKPNHGRTPLRESPNSKVILQVINGRWEYPNGTLGVTVADLTLWSNRIYVVCGPNGGGKSSLARLLTSNKRMASGSQLKFRQEIISNPFKELVCKNHLRFSFQDPNLHMSGSTVRDYLSPLSMDSNIINAMKLSDYLDQDLLSSPLWVRQAVVFIAAVAEQVEIILLDEPVDGIAYQIFGEACVKVLEKRANEDAVVIVITHNPSFARQIADEYIWVDEQTVWPRSSLRENRLLAFEKWANGA